LLFELSPVADLDQKVSRNAIWIKRGLFNWPLTTPNSELPNWLPGG
jgi:hypothetical protein